MDSIGNITEMRANAMQNYNHTYVFDELGNMQSDNWKDYVYDTDTNRLLKHDPDQTLNDYTYDVHGNMLTMPHLTSMVWDFADRLQSAGNGTFTSYYNYDLGGNRSRKVVVKSNIREERYYFGDYEIYRKYVNDTKTLERSTVHIIDDRDRFAMIETETGNNPVVRYQYNNHLGSACLELDSTAAIISYEEYHPYGTTSYRSGRTETEVSLKRYKYVGKERDEETGLYYYGARYYAAWLCRFVSVDPLQFKYPHYTPYQYAGNKPISYIDLDGLEEAKKGVDLTIKPAEYHTKCFGEVTDNGDLGKLADNTVTAVFNIITGVWNLGVNTVSTVNYNVDFLKTFGPSLYFEAVKNYWSGETDQLVKNVKSLKNLTPQDIDDFLSSPQGFELMVGIAASEFGVKLSRGAKGEIVAEPMESETTVTNSKSIAKSKPTVESTVKTTSKGGNIVNLSEETLSQAMLKGAENVEGYNIYGTKGLVGKTYVRNIFLIEASGAKKLSSFSSMVRRLETEAIKSGANSISIYGSTVLNSGFLSPSIAKRFGYTLQRSGRGVFLQKILTQ